MILPKAVGIWSCQDSGESKLAPYSIVTDRSL